MVRLSICAVAGLGVLLAGCTTWRDDALSAAQRGDGASLCRLASENQNDPAAFGILGACNEYGWAGTRDAKAAIAYYTLAARYGVPAAQARLTELGQPVPPADLARPSQPSALEALGAGFQGMGSVARSGGATPQQVPLTPIYTPPVQTNCQWVGSLWTCTSQ